MKYRNRRFSIINVLFLVSYALFVFSLFNRDVSDISIFYFMTILAKYLSLAILVFGVLYKKSYSRKQIQWIVMLLVIDTYLLIESSALIFVLITLFAVFSTELNDSDILKMAYYTLVVYTVITIFLCAFGIYHDVLTNRWVGSNNRHSFGFYHSNVLPLIFSYLVGYGLLGNILKRKHYFIIVILDVLIYYFCGSRNALTITILLIAGKIFVDSKFIKGKLKRKANLIIGFLAKFIVPILAAVSIGVPLLMDKIKILMIFDYLLSYRFTAIAKIIENEGIHFMTKMTNEMYFSNEIIIDNGYAFLSIRYGLLMIILLSFFAYVVARRYKDNTFVLIVIILVACSNLIDNDLIDYSCLPYLIISEKCIIEGTKRRRKFYGRSYKCNNECL